MILYLFLQEWMPCQSMRHGSAAITSVVMKFEDSVFAVFYAPNGFRMAGPSSVQMNQSYTVYMDIPSWLWIPLPETNDSK